MNNDRAFDFLVGFVLGGIVGAATALMFAPASGKATRGHIRSEGVAIKNRGQAFGDERMQDAQEIMKQGQKGVSNVQARLSGAIEDEKDHLQEAIEAGKHAASLRKDEILSRSEADKTQVRTKA